jgi:hypothetical protein
LRPERVVDVGYLAPLERLSRRDLEEALASLSTQKSRARDVRLPYAAAWWAHLSNVQKSVRRGAIEQALDSAERLYRYDPIKTRRRLAVVALEDISYGNLLTTATALMYAVSAAKEASEADLARCLGLVAKMAGSTKDRLVCELVGAAVDSPSARADILKIANAPALERAALYRAEDADLRDRCIAGLALVGALTLDGKRVGARDRNPLIAAAMDMELPDAVVLILEHGLRLGGEIAALASVLPVFYKGMRSQDVRIERQPLPEAPLIEGVLSTALDKHTRAGLRALSTYRQRWKPLAEFLRKNVRDPRRAIHTLAFRSEGALLDREIACDLGDQVFAWNEKAQCDAIGMEYAALPAAKHAFLGGLHILNGFRQQAIAAELRAHAKGKK